MVKKKQADTKKMNPFLWFLFAIIVPIGFTITLVTIILLATGVDVGGWVKGKAAEIPGVSSFVDEDDGRKAKDVADTQLKSQIENKDSEIKQLQEELKDKETTIQMLEQDIIKLQDREQNQTEEQQKKDENQTKKNSFKSMSTSFKEMDEEKAAQILQDLKRKTALAILEELDDKERGKILEVMDATTAAQLTEQFLNKVEEE
ncbi:MotE family protein [Virgibacillus sp. Bac330]|uniref:MotE family protein n=1 Tax=Virgibacillus sp. Bac330 TaxID=2419841 RepID=UPI000EF5257C|nr:hypothetical protein [Virgibacillus sp. Bac330]